MQKPQYTFEGLSLERTSYIADLYYIHEHSTFCAVEFILHFHVLIDCQVHSVAANTPRIKTENVQARRADDSLLPIRRS